MAKDIAQKSQKPSASGQPKPQQKAKSQKPNAKKVEAKPQIQKDKKSKAISKKKVDDQKTGQKSDKIQKVSKEPKAVSPKAKVAKKQIAAKQDVKKQQVENQKSNTKKSNDKAQAKNEAKQNAKIKIVEENKSDLNQSADTIKIAQVDEGKVSKQAQQKGPKNKKEQLLGKKSKTQQSQKDKKLGIKDEDFSDEEVIKPTLKRTTARQAAMLNKNQEVKNDLVMLDSDFEEPRKKKSKVVKRGVPSNAKPQMPKVSAKKQKDIPPDYLKFVPEPNDFDPENVIENHKLSGENNLINLECCVHCTNKNVLRAAITKNNDLLMKCLLSPKQVSGFLITWAPESRWTPVEWVFYNDDMKGLDILLEFDKKSQKLQRVIPQPFLIGKFDTGSVSEATYGVEVRKVFTARGNRAGNEAFLQESEVEENSILSYLQNQYFVARLVRMPNLKYEHIEKIMSLSKDMNNFVINNLTQKLLINGKVEIAEKIIKLFVKDPIYGVNELMHASLIAQDITELPQNYNKLSVNRKSNHFGGIIPLHTAALNPNLDILKRLLNMISSNPNLKFEGDNLNNQCIHYAAACDNPGPLELLIARDFNVNYANSEKDTPLFIAVQCNKPRNALIIIQEDEDSIYYKNDAGYYPIHVAARLGYNDCIRVLCKYDKQHVDVPGGFAKMTPLMYAAAYGNYETAIYLVKTMRANVNLLDKFQRSALSYAVRNGHTKIASFLLQHLAFYEYPDNSMNYPLHFACAYGWGECVDMLLKAGANINCKNEWGYTPLLIAMLKNHKEIVKKLLSIEGVDINGTDDQGRNLLSYSIQGVTEENFEYIKYLINEKGADPHQQDLNGDTSLFYAIQAFLPVYSEKFSYKETTPEILKQKVSLQESIHFKILDYLINQQKCKIDCINKQGISPIDLILSSRKFYLLPLLSNKIDLNERPELLFQIDSYLFMKHDSLLKELILKTKIKEEYLNGVNSNGESLLMVIFNRYIQLRATITQTSTFLQCLRFVNLASDFEQNQDFSKSVSRETFYQHCKSIQDFDFLLEYIMSKGSHQFIQVEKVYQQDIVNKVREKQNEIVVGSKTDPQTAQQVANELFRDHFASKIKNFIQILLDQGADINQYSFNVAFLASEIGIPEALKLQNKDASNPQIANFIYQSSDYLRNLIIPLTKKQNKDISERVSDCRQQFHVLIYDQSLQSQLSRTQNQAKYNTCTKESVHKLIAQSRSPLMLKFFIKNGLDVNQVNHLDQSLLISISQQLGSETQTFKLMYEQLKKAKNLDKNVTDSNGNSAFLILFQNRYLESANYLLDQGFDPNFKNKNSETALIMAVKQNNFELVEMLVEKGVDLNTQDKQGRSALHYAVSNSSCALDANYDIENILISSGADVNLQDKNGRTPLHYAFVKIGKGNQDKSPMDPIETVSSLCSNKQANPKIQDKYGKNVLHYAAQRGATISTMYLEKKGVDLHQKDIFGNTPLATALLCNHTQYSIMLIKEGSDVNQLVHPESKQIYEEYKKARKATQTIEEKDEGYKSDDSYFNGASGGYQSHSHYQIQNTGGLFGGNIFGGSIFGNNNNYQHQQQNNVANRVQEPQTMFKLAVDSGQLGLSYLILDNGFDLMKAMEDSLKKLKFQFVVTLLQKVSDNSLIQKTNNKQQNLFHIFAQNASTLNPVGQNKILTRIYKQFKRRDLDINSKDVYGRTPLHYAAMSGSHSLVKLFTEESNIDLNKRDINGITPLIASLKGERLKNRDNFEVFKILAKVIGDCNDLYFDPQYENIKLERSPNSDEMMMIDTEIPKYKVTLFNHLIRQFDQVEKALRTELLNFMFGENCRCSLFDKDINGKQILMILVEQNNMYNLEEVFKLWENALNLRKEPIVIQDEVDKEGRNIVHCQITLSKIGMYDNVPLLEFLIEKGFSYSIKDAYGKRPVDYAAQYKNTGIFKRLQKLGQVPVEFEQREKSAFDDQDDNVEMIYTEQEIDFLKDAEKFLELNKDKLKIDEKSEGIKPDPILGDQVKSLQVVTAEQDNQDTAYNAYLIKIDIKRYGHSPYVFYKLQLNHDPEKNIYILLTRWGMIGEQGMCQKTPFNKLEDAVAEFRKIFKTKTSNDWDNRKDFQISKAKNKYILFEQKRANYSYTDLIKPFKWSECQRSQLSDQEQSFMKLISNVAIYNEALKLQDVQKSQMNLTHIPKENLEEAMEHLKSLEVVYSGGVLSNKSNNYDQYSNNYQEEQNKQIVSLSIKIYQLIPMLKEGQEGPKPIDRNSLPSFKNKLYDLLTLEKASKIFLGATLRKSEQSPLDYIYRVLNINVQKLETSSDDYQLITQYMKNTSKSVFGTQEVNQIFKIKRSEDEVQFEKMNYTKDPQRLLLFHGTSLQNILGILNCGFKLSPMGVSQCGALFGQGVYFSNFFEKSYNYARPSNMSQLHLDDEELQIITDESALMNRRYILVCEIAMGKLLKYEQHYKPNQYNRYGGYHGGSNINYYAIGSQVQLKEIFNDLIKVEEEIKQELIAPQLSDYEDQDSDSDFNDNEEDDVIMNEEDDLKFGQLSQTKEAVKTPEAVYKDQIVEYPNGKIIYGKKADITRTLRGHRMMHLKGNQKINKFDTFWVGGTQIPDPQFNVMLKDGSIVPTGKSTPVMERPAQQKQSISSQQIQGGLFNNNNLFQQQQYIQQQAQQIQFQGNEFSEFVVKNPDRIKIRYLIELREMTAAEKIAKSQVQQRVSQFDE